MTATTTTIQIVSGEGTHGTVESHTGRPTAAAVWRRMLRERCGGDRWSHALIDGEHRCHSLEDLRAAGLP